MRCGSSATVKGVMAPPAAEPAAGGLWLRMVSAAVLAPPALFAVHLGFPYFDLLVALAAGAMAFEWYRLCGHRHAVSGGVMGVGVLAGVLLAALERESAALAVLALGMGLTLAGKRVEGRPRGWLGAGVFYIGLPTMAAVWLRHDPVNGRETVLWIFVLVWASDVGGYVLGRLLGGPKLAPAISPNKTWAGLAGAVLGAGLVGLSAAIILGKGVRLPLAGFSAGLGVVAQAGDLAESWVKRRFGVKDSGGLIPGHGGVLDRVDALLAVLAATAMATLVLEGMAGEDDPLRGGVLAWL